MLFRELQRSGRQLTQKMVRADSTLQERLCAEAKEQDQGELDAQLDAARPVCCRLHPGPGVNPLTQHTVIAA